MKEYDYREYYEIGERLKAGGHIIEVVEDKYREFCEGCFLSIPANYNINCSIHCAGSEREDDTPVHFRMVDMAKENTPEYAKYDPNKDYAVYERFQYNGVVAECRECSSSLLCRDCVLYPCIGPVAMNCIGLNRKDGLSVYFKRLDDVRP